MVITRTCEHGPAHGKRDFAEGIKDPEVGVTLGSQAAQRPQEVLRRQRQGVGVREMVRPPAAGCEDVGGISGQGVWVASRSQIKVREEILS